MASRRSVVITGAAGNIGGKLRRHLEAHGGYELVLIDRDSADDAQIVRADLSMYDDAWASTFRNADVVVHLAANPDPTPPWDELIPTNLDAVMNVFQAAVAERAKRVIYASSVHAFGVHGEDEARAAPDEPPNPDNAYGAMKLMGERIGMSFADRFGISVICLRLGWVQLGDNLPNDEMADALRKVWLSNGDMLRLMELAIGIEDVPFVVLNAMSANAGSRWDLSETRRVLGYEPYDDASDPKWRTAS